MGIKMYKIILIILLTILLFSICGCERKYLDQNVYCPFCNEGKHIKIYTEPNNNDGTPASNIYGIDKITLEYRCDKCGKAIRFFNNTLAVPIKPEEELIK